MAVSGNPESSVGQVVIAANRTPRILVNGHDPFASGAWRGQAVVPSVSDVGGIRPVADARRTTVSVPTWCSARAAGDATFEAVHQLVVLLRVEVSIPIEHDGH